MYPVSGGELIAGLDIGASSVRAIIGRRDQDRRLHVLGVGLSRCNGICYGEVVDPAETTRAIRAAVRDAELFAGVESPPLRVGIYGFHILKHTFQGRPEHHLPSGHGGRGPWSLIHCFARHAGDEKGAQKTLAVSAPSRVVDEILQCLRAAQVPVSEIAWTPLNIGALLPLDLSRRSDALIIDLGEEFTVGILVRRGRTHDVFRVARGGEAVTNNIAIAFGLGFQEAERIKVAEGFAMPDLSEQYDPIRTPYHSVKSLDVIYSIQVARVIEFGTLEILGALQEELESAGYPMSIARVYLTGGGSALRGLPQLVTRFFGVPAVTGWPVPTAGGLDLQSAPGMSGGLGVVCGAMVPEYRGYVLPLSQPSFWRRWRRGLGGLFRGDGRTHAGWRGAGEGA